MILYYNWTTDCYNYSLPDDGTYCAQVPAPAELTVTWLLSMIKGYWLVVQWWNLTVDIPSAGSPVWVLSKINNDQTKNVQITLRPCHLWQLQLTYRNAIYYKRKKRLNVYQNNWNGKFGKKVEIMYCFEKIEYWANYKSQWNLLKVNGLNNSYYTIGTIKYDLGLKYGTRKWLQI